VKANDPTNAQASYMPTLDVRPGGTLRISNRRLDEIIMVAYGISGSQISGPRWLTELTTDPSQVTRFEIVAKVPEDATKDLVPLMLQRLLEDRFKLRVHRESRPMQVYSLEVWRSRHKLNSSVANGGRPPARAIGTGETYSAAADCSGITMAQFAQQLPALDFRLEWRRLDELQAGASGQTIFEAVSKLGLNLEKKRETAEMLIVDNCERMPTEN
jgi:uncharacterized protein (TIGR03435 family)